MATIAVSMVLGFAGMYVTMLTLLPRQASHRLPLGANTLYNRRFSNTTPGK
jgi:hypothetical protein